jgi:pimeloyl-ACP methyl ester carboxylesterase
MYDIMIPDHRGTGRSSPLYCYNYTADLSMECVQYALAHTSNATLAAYSTTNAAHDLYAAMVATKDNIAVSDPVFVYGVSYGSYWTQR